MCDTAIIVSPYLISILKGLNKLIHRKTLKLHHVYNVSFDKCQLWWQWSQLLDKTNDWQNRVFNWTVFGFSPMLSLGGTGSRVICSDCYDNANIYSRTREYCPYTYIAEEDVLDQTLSSLMVQMPKETYLAHPPQDATTLESLVSSADRERSAFPTNHERINEKKFSSAQMSSGKGHSVFCYFGWFSLSPTWFFLLSCP